MNDRGAGRGGLPYPKVGGKKCVLLVFLQYACFFGMPRAWVCFVGFDFFFQVHSGGVFVGGGGGYRTPQVRRSLSVKKMCISAVLLVACISTSTTRCYKA